MCLFNCERDSPKTSCASVALVGVTRVGVAALLRRTKLKGKECFFFFLLLLLTLNCAVAVAASFPFRATRGDGGEEEVSFGVIGGFLEAPGRPPGGGSSDSDMFADSPFTKEKFRRGRRRLVTLTCSTKSKRRDERERSWYDPLNYRQRVQPPSPSSPPMSARRPSEAEMALSYGHSQFVEIFSNALSANLMLQLRGRDGWVLGTTEKYLDRRGETT